ncbi:MAG TPA: GLPGLI family protein [Saprospiraceae bacterium]|nr:GLPGLI family protein [Saprospiraceae bacterium]MCB9269455.1 GLPGLI family protein [Lewinellaceae bacterium]HPG06923.1 GLPGLI family protein [Saprospiraceae bacterium]HPQ98521.1 GLPGLI family protein [Saprospiraceae bacterium]HQU52714.1 GLPGLI family protein [Saprospiraceae bacterium]
MKYLAGLITLLCFHFTLAAQEAGTITYAQTVRLEFKFEGAPPPQMGRDMPKEHTLQMVLIRKGDEVQYRLKDQGEPGNDMNFTSEEGGQVNIRMAPPQDILYENLADARFIEQKEFLGKKFLIKDALPTFEWKLTGKSKQILDYPCQEAILQDTSKNVVAWFSPMIPWQLGPGKYAGLPGLILEIIQDDGQRVLTATSVELSEPAVAIEVPDKGKEVTQEEYDKIVEEKMKEMGGRPGSGGQIHMIIRQN